MFYTANGIKQTGHQRVNHARHYPNGENVIKKTDNQRISRLMRYVLYCKLKGKQQSCRHTTNDIKIHVDRQSANKTSQTLRSILQMVLKR